MKKYTILPILSGLFLLIAACDEPKNKTSDVIDRFSVTTIDTSGIASLVATGWVNDFEGIFTGQEKRSLDSLIDKYEKETTIEIGIVTLDTTRVGPDVTDMYEATLTIAKNWGVGKKEKDNGILIGVSKGRMQMYIQNGIGIEKMITDEQTQKIVDEVFIPLYAQGKYFEGTFEGTRAIMELLRDK